MVGLVVKDEELHKCRNLLLSSSDQTILMKITFHVIIRGFLHNIYHNLNGHSALKLLMKWLNF